MDSLKPLKLQKWETQGIKIHWSDGHISQYRSRSVPIISRRQISG